MSGIILHFSQLYFLRQGLLLNLELTNLARLLGQQASGTLPSLPASLRLWAHVATPELFFLFLFFSI